MAISHKKQKTLLPNITKLIIYKTMKKFIVHVLILHGNMEKSIGLNHKMNIG